MLYVNIIVTGASRRASDLVQLFQDILNAPENQHQLFGANHKFTTYILDNDATCLLDGHMSAVCDYGCGWKDMFCNFSFQRRSLKLIRSYLRKKAKVGSKYEKNN